MTEFRASRRQLLRAGGATALAAGLGPAVLTGCGGSGDAAGGGGRLSFMYWGSAFEKKAIDEMLKKYAGEHQGARPASTRHRSPPGPRGAGTTSSRPRTS